MTGHIPVGYAAASTELWLTNYPRPAVVTMGLEINGTDNGGGTTIADVWHGCFADAMRPQFDNSVTIRNSRVIVGQDGEPLIFESTLQTQGALTRDSTAPAMAVMVTKLTGVGGRRNRGRMFLPWIVGENNVGENGALSSGAVNALTECVDELYTLLTDVAPPLSLIEGPVILHSDPEATPTPITGFTVNPTIRTQRRRQVRY